MGSTRGKTGLVFAVALQLLCVLAGCQLINEQFGANYGQEITAAKLPPIKKSLGTITLDFLIAERVSGDPLLGNLLWDKLDQIGAIDADVREILLEDGFRVGVTGSAPPDALQQLLGLTTEIPDPLEIDNGSQSGRRRVTLRNNAATEVHPGEERFEECVVELPIDGTRVESKFENARFVMRVTAKQLQPGWAEVEFLPEIHHGNSQMRREVGAGGLALRGGQAIEKLYQYRFTVTLNEGEMAIVTSDGPQSPPLGKHFFVRSEGSARFQRVLVVRLAETASIEPLYTSSMAAN